MKYPECDVHTTHVLLYVHHTRLGVIYIIGEHFVSYTSVSGTRFHYDDNDVDNACARFIQAINVKLLKRRLFVNKSLRVGIHILAYVG